MGYNDWYYKHVIHWLSTQAWLKVNYKGVEVINKGTEVNYNGVQVNCKCTEMNK